MSASLSAAPPPSPPPRVSVVLPVYNVAAHITETIGSLLGQTYANFELLVLDDCSTDETAAKVQAIRDPRLRFIQNPRNLGRAGTDNAALAHVRGEFVAKMDGDDLCHPERLARQVAFLDQNPAVNVVGTWLQNFESSRYLARYPTTPAAARVMTLFTLPTGNPTVMLRTGLFEQQGLRYDATLRQTEDYDFFARYLRQLHVATLPAALVRYRVPPSVSKTQILTERAAVADQVRAQLLSAWNLPHTARELQVHNAISLLDRPLGDITLAEVDAWLRKLLHHNTEQPWFETAALRRGLGERWFEVCYTHAQPGLGSIRQFRSSALAAHFSLTAAQWLKFGARAIQHL
ncbi:glycosyltransferase family 2 protein [uncultured Hymenobacter sp.]|uniref:glycosyltransferase family 2 protein n=1 Tax=uncultured Hymenobacter sp. TaxID=170016 RepID=UPI0035CA3308